MWLYFIIIKSFAQFLQHNYAMKLHFYNCGCKLAPSLVDLCLHSHKRETIKPTLRPEPPLLCLHLMIWTVMLMEQNMTNGVDIEKTRSYKEMTFFQNSLSRIPRCWIFFLWKGYRTLSIEFKNTTLLKIYCSNKRDL